MPIPLLHTVLSWFLKKRVHQIELFLKYPHEVQQEVLQKLMTQGKNTVFGKQHGFQSIKNYEDFTNQVPLATYEDLAPLIERTRKGEQNLFWPTPIKWFAKSSGTTNAKSKFIPVSKESLEDCHFKGGKDMLSLYFNNNEGSKLFQGKALRLGGSKALYEDNNSYFGDLSAIIIENLPLWAELASTPSHKISMMDEWESKMKAIVAECKDQDITSLAGVPSWMLVLLQKVLKETGKQNLIANFSKSASMHQHLPARTLVWMSRASARSVVSKAATPTPTASMTDLVFSMFTGMRGPPSCGQLRRSRLK